MWWYDDGVEPATETEMEVDSDGHQINGYVID